jgi:uracil-DNA glycosylase family 4
VFPRICPAGTCMADCTATTCAFGRICVPSVGPIPADIQVICEAPGFKELEQLEPLVGPAGQLFNKLLAACGLLRSSLFLSNTCGCVELSRDDKKPLPAEIEACRPRLLADIEMVKPKLIVPMGNVAIGMFYPGAKIGQVHGKLRNWNGHIVMPSYHPAAALPFRNPELQQVIIDDIKTALDVI